MAMKLHHFSADNIAPSTMTREEYYRFTEDEDKKTKVIKHCDDLVYSEHGGRVHAKNLNGNTGQKATS